MQSLITTHPNIINDVKALMDEGLTKSAIARRLGISRDRLRTLMSKYHLNDLYERKPPLSFEEVEAAVQIFVTGISWKEIAESLNISSHKIRNNLSRYGFDLNEITAVHRRHRWDGRVYGYWTVLPGTTGIEGHATVKTECVCGKQVVQLKSNLISGASKSCGCVGLKINTVGDKSTHYSWTCVETGQVVATTNELARHTRIKPAKLYRKASRNQTFLDPMGYTWVPAEYQLRMPRRRDLTPDLDFIREQLDSGRSIASIGVELGVELPVIYRFTKEHNLSSQRQGSESLNSDEVHEIKRLATIGFSPITISHQLNIRPSVVYNLLSGKTYKRLQVQSD